MPEKTAGQGPTTPQKQEKPRLFLDKEGRWFHEGVEITHERTRQLFAKNIRRDSSGAYHVHVGGQSAEVTVEDTPYTVRSVTVRKGPDGRPEEYVLHLNDETQESLAPESLSISAENVLYCRVKGGTERARFLRAAYYQICAGLEYDETLDRYWLPCRDGKITIESNDRPQE
jgi:hypothetical protein